MPKNLYFYIPQTSNWKPLLTWVACSFFSWTFILCFSSFIECNFKRLYTWFDKRISVMSPAQKLGGNWKKWQNFKWKGNLSRWTSHGHCSKTLITVRKGVWHPFIFKFHPLWHTLLKNLLQPPFYQNFSTQSINPHIFNRQSKVLFTIWHT